MKNRILVASTVLALATALVGCAQPPATVAPPSAIHVVAPGEGMVTASMHLAVEDVTGRRVLDAAGLEPWKKADIDHVKLSLYKDGTLVTSTTVAGTSLGGTVTFSKLHMNSSYAVVAEAWADAQEATRIDAGQADAASCTTTFETTTVETLDAGAIKLKLQTKIFSGTTTGSTIAVTDGIIESVNATETVEVVTPLTLTAVSPASGTVYGNTAVTLTGTNFTGATAVTFAGMPATSIIVVSDTQIIATTPFFPTSNSVTVDVSVVTASGTATAAGAYTFVPAPSVYSMSPTMGGLLGGETMVINGSNLANATVTFGGVPGTIVANSSGSISVIVPPGSSLGSVDVDIQTAGGRTTFVGGYTYMDGGIPG